MFLKTKNSVCKKLVWHRPSNWDLLTPGYGLPNKQRAHTLILNMHGWTLIDSKGYVKIMLKKKLMNPIVPKNRNLLSIFKTEKRKENRKILKMLILKKLWKPHNFFHDSSPLFKENLTQWIGFLLIIVCAICISIFINADCTEIYYVNVILRIFYANCKKIILLPKKIPTSNLWNISSLGTKGNQGRWPSLVE